MSTMYFGVKSVSRGRGSSAVGKAAYDARERLRDERSHRTYDYRGRGGLVHSEILRPAAFRDSRTDWVGDRATLWNSAEAAEKAANARVAREYIVALPHELSASQRLALARQFAQGIADRYGTVVDLAVHTPPRGGDARNHHAHVLSTTRTLGAHGLERKAAIELSDTARRQQGLPRVAQEIRTLRHQWAELANAHLADAKIAARLDPRRLEEQGIDRVPQRMLSRAAIEIERRGGHAFTAEWNRRELEATAAAKAEQAAVPTLEDRQQAAARRWLAYREARAHLPPQAAREPARAPVRDRSRDLGFGLG